MEKIVTSGEQDCTVELDGTECAVIFSSNYRCFTVQNDTAGDIFISISPNIAAGKDGVRRVASGASSSLAHGRNNADTLYILGTGSVQVAASDSPGNFFKSAPAQGGGGNSYSKLESDAKYAQKTDIPTTLPANGGTADNVVGIIILTGENIKTASVEGAVKWAVVDNTTANTDGFVTAGIWFKNNLSYAVTAQIIAYANKKTPTVQAGYGTGTFREMFNTGRNREWYSNNTLETTPTPINMVVPAGKTGYFGFYNTQNDVYAIIDDANVFTTVTTRFM